MNPSISCQRIQVYHDTLSQFHGNLGFQLCLSKIGFILRTLYDFFFVILEKLITKTIQYALQINFIVSNQLFLLWFLIAWVRLSKFSLYFYYLSYLLNIHYINLFFHHSQPDGTQRLLESSFNSKAIFYFSVWINCTEIFRETNHKRLRLDGDIVFISCSLIR